jgi:hypothetical protein
MAHRFIGNVLIPAFSLCIGLDAELQMQRLSRQNAAAQRILRYSNLSVLREFLAGLAIGND